MKCPGVFTLLLLLLLNGACKKNYTCICNTNQIAYGPGLPNGVPNSFDRSYGYSEYNQKKAEQNCYSNHAAETYTNAGPTQTTVITTTCMVR